MGKFLVHLLWGSREQIQCEIVWIQHAEWVGLKNYLHPELFILDQSNNRLIQIHCFRTPLKSLLFFFFQNLQFPFSGL